MLMPFFSMAVNCLYLIITFFLSDSCQTSLKSKQTAYLHTKFRIILYNSLDNQVFCQSNPDCLISLKICIGSLFWFLFTWLGDEQHRFLKDWGFFTRSNFALNSSLYQNCASYYKNIALPCWGLHCSSFTKFCHLLEFRTYPLMKSFFSYSFWLSDLAIVIAKTSAAKPNPLFWVTESAWPNFGLCLF